MFLIFRSMHKNFVEKLKIAVKNSEKLNGSYGKVSHDHNSLSSRPLSIGMCFCIDIIFKNGIFGKLLIFATKQQIEEIYFYLKNLL